MSALESYLIQLSRQKGLMRQNTLYATRNYVKAITRIELSRAIRRINHPVHLKILWEIGLSAEMQIIASARMNELSTRREGLE